VFRGFFGWEFADDVLNFTWASMKDGHMKRGFKKSGYIKSMSYIRDDIMWFKNVS